MAKKTNMTLHEASKNVLFQLNAPSTLVEVVQKILTIRPTRAKKPEPAIRNHLRQKEAGRLLVFLDKDTIVPMNIALNGVRFCIPARAVINENGLLTREWFAPFDSRIMELKAKSSLLNDEGLELPPDANDFIKNLGMGFAFEEYNPSKCQGFENSYGFNLTEWQNWSRLTEEDVLIITIENLKRQIYHIETEKISQYQARKIEKHDKEFADIIFETLESTGDSYISALKAIATAYARMSKDFLGNHWRIIIRDDPRMNTDGTEIRYANAISSTEMIFQRVAQSMGARVGAEKQPSELQENQVYCFEVFPRKHREHLCCIEIQGKHTLTVFDSILRKAFQYDSKDQMSGFWEIMETSFGGEITRDVHLGNTGTKLRINQLKLHMGEWLKYVYDLNNWFEHVVTLKKNKKPEKGVKYPRVVGRSKPGAFSSESLS